MSADPSALPSTRYSQEPVGSPDGEQLRLGLDDLLRPSLPDPIEPAAHRKKLGAYYTDAVVASFLVRWALRDGREIVMDPSSGDGVFLAAAAHRIRQLGGSPELQVYGVEIDSATHRRVASRSTSDLSASHLLRANFFDVNVGDLPAADAVVGNPPFIRYQRFNGEFRDKALRRAREAGVQISQLASSWAPFLIHAIQFVKPSGRLAMVVPAELAHAGYARPVLDYLRRAFRTVRILVFSRRLFPKLSEDTVLLLADGRGDQFESLALIDLPGPSALESFADPPTELPRGTRVDVSSIGEGARRLLHYLLPRAGRELYQELQDTARVQPLGELANVGIGYVTGENDFFHLDGSTVAAYNLPSRFLRPAVRAGSQLAGLRFTREDWEALHGSGHANLLLHIPDARPLPEPLQAYLLQGIRRRVPERYKCRVRKPWYRVPHVYEAHGFLTYMSGTDSKLVANEAAAVAPNTLHIVRLHPGCRFDAETVAAAWQTSLTALSCELEGHSLGGGMLKLEPTEARRVLVALPDLGRKAFHELASEMDGLLRDGKIQTARERADDVLLRAGLGLSQVEIQRLRDSYLSLRARRLNR